MRSFRSALSSVGFGLEYDRSVILFGFFCEFFSGVLLGWGPGILWFECVLVGLMLDPQHLISSDRIAQKFLALLRF